MCAELLPVHQDCDIGENVSASQPVQVEQDITRVACELYAAVCCASHFLKICKQQTNILGSIKRLDFVYKTIFCYPNNTELC